MPEKQVLENRQIFAPSSCSIYNLTHLKSLYQTFIYTTSFKSETRQKENTYLKTAYDVCTKFARLHKVLSLAAMLIVHMQNIFVTFACTIISSEELSLSPRYSTLKVDFF